MKVLFLQNYWHEQIGVMQISAVLKNNGHTADLLISEKPDIIIWIKNSNYDLVAFSSISGQHVWALKTAKEIKTTISKNIKIIMGGPHPTFFPKVIESPYIDIICIGEGEYAMLELLEKIETNQDICNINNMYVKQGNKIYKNEVRPQVSDLDSLPFPDRELYCKYSYFSDNHIKNFIAIRGCPFSCTYCNNYALKKIYKGPYTNYRSVENVIAEIEAVKSKYRLEVVRFQDDIFALNKEWLHKFCSEYSKRIELPFICYVMANLIDEDMVRDLKNAGCICVSFGIESGDQDYRMKNLGKPVTDENIIETGRLLHKYGLSFYTQNMFGMPGETIEMGFKTVELNMRIKGSVTGAIFQPMPGTKITQDAIDKGLIRNEDVDNIGSSYQKSLLKQRYIKELVNLCHFFYLTILCPKILTFVKYLIKLPPNRIFLLFYQISDAISFAKRTRMSLKRFFIEIFHHYKYHLD